ncbi:hypothetical protein [Pseudomonas promysalinigenes]|uniref:hypothetical protein n=1 Tax=Pseudomonas promysalinigenes TaxID=485898 RepID=UPI0016442D23|nr:hypothetical protein [Pseudomonas promysalinigenes]QXI35050.1 hypothetical protein HU725_006800 [Pseudomonas promysalinigenes]
MELSRRNILIPATLAILSATLNMQALASDPVDPIGGVTLMSKNNEPCKMIPPAEGSGLTYNYATNSPAYSCYPATARSVQFDRLPSAMEIIFSSRPDCNTQAAEDNEYWIKFKTTATNTGSPHIYSFEELQNYAKNQIIFRGLKIVDKKQAPGDRMRDATSCVKFTASGNIDTPEALDSLTLADTTGIPAGPEHRGDERVCLGSSMIYERKHSGDETKDTSYGCRLAEHYEIRDRKWSVSFRESGLDPEEASATPSAKDKRYIYFTCPINTVMTGRQHTGDENGNTRYQCASLVDANNGRIVLVEPTQWSPEFEESSKIYETCPTNQIMIGRAHKNDEKGETRYLCATLRPAAQ